MRPKFTTFDRLGVSVAERLAAEMRSQPECITENQVGPGSLRQHGGGDRKNSKDSPVGSHMDFFSVAAGCADCSLDRPRIYLP